MKMHVLGCSHHRTPVRLREQLAFSSEQARYALGRLCRQFPGTEAVLLSTCNRVELYTATSTQHPPTTKELAQFVATFHGLDASILAGQLDGREDAHAIKHLFGVTSSLDSMVVGEPQIASQVKAAYQMAREQKATGPLTHAAFQAAFRTAHLVATETDIHRHRVSIPSVAVADFAKRVFERFDDKNVLLIGAGEMASDTMEYLRAEGARQVSVVNRSPSRGEELAARWNGQSRPWDELLVAIATADLIVSTTSAPDVIVTDSDFRELEKTRKKHPLLILDLAVPRDFDPSVGRRSWVYLYSVDDLRAACEANRRRRQRDLPNAMSIVEREARQFMWSLNHRAVGPMVQRLRRNWQDVKGLELERLNRKLPELDEKSRIEVAYAFDRFVNKLLHPPLESLRRESRNGVPEKLLHAVSQLFKLEE